MWWAARRILISLLLIWIASSIVFRAIRFVPGDPAKLLLSQGGIVLVISILLVTLNLLIDLLYGALDPRVRRASSSFGPCRCCGSA